MADEFCLDKEHLYEAEEWLNVLKNPFGHIEEGASISKFHSRHFSGKSFVSINQLRLIFPESINTHAIARHCAKIIDKLREK